MTMTDSRIFWGMLGGAGALVVAAAGAVFVASTQYRMEVRVRDARGPLAGAWVAWNDGVVHTTDAEGQVRLQARRFEFADALLTASDSSLSTLRLSQSLRIQPSWIPWVRTSFIEINLPDMGTQSPLESVRRELKSGLEIPWALAQSPSATGAEETSFEPPLREEVLSDGGESSAIASVKLDAALLELSRGRVFVFVCMSSGLSPSFCFDSETPSLFPNSTAPAPKKASEASVADQLGEKSIPEQTLAISSPGSVSLTGDESSSSSVGTALVRMAVRVEVLLAGKPLDGAQVYMSRLRDNRVRELGRTSSDGSLEVRLPHEFWGETVTVFHACCAPRTFSAKLAKQGNDARLRLEVQEGKGFGVLVQHDAYGFLRKFNSFEMLSPEGKLAVSGQDGFALYDSSKTPLSTLQKVVIRGARPTDFFTDSQTKRMNSSLPLAYLVAPDEVYRPALAILETNEGRSFTGVLKNAALRRWRRDFMARMMQQTSLRALVSAESEARLSAAGESAVAVSSNGWSKTPLAGEWDFLLTIDYSDNKGGVRLSGVNHEGENFYSHNNLFSKDTGELPEQRSRRDFESLVNQFPFEGYVLRQDGQRVDLTFESEKDYGLKDDTPLAFYQVSTSETGQRPIELAALGLIESQGSSSGVRARVTHWNNKTRKTAVFPDVVRVLKVTQDFYKREAVRSQMAKSNSKKGL